MAFTSSTSGKTVFGDLRVVYGTWATDTTTGNINTGLNTVLSMQITPNGSSIVADAPTINETLPCAGNAVTIICTSATTGYWIAFGK
jgi:hypothetical protein